MSKEAIISGSGTGKTLHQRVGEKIEKYYDEKGNADHYNSDRINCLRMSEVVWGTYNLMVHFEIVIFEYKYRLGKKDSDSIEQQVLKIKWYERAVKYLRDKIEAGDAIEGFGPGNHGLPEQIQNA